MVNLAELKPGNAARSLDVLQFAVLKADTIEGLDENPFGTGSRAWHRLVNRILSQIPTEVANDAALPQRIYGYEYSRSGADQILDILHQFDKFVANENRYYHPDGSVSEHGIISSLVQEARFLDTLQHDPNTLSTRGLARIRTLQKVQSIGTLVMSDSGLEAPSAIVSNLNYYRLAQEDDTARLTSYGSRYLQFVEEAYQL